MSVSEKNGRSIRNLWERDAERAWQAHLGNFWETHGGAKFISDNDGATVCLPPSIRPAFLLVGGTFSILIIHLCWRQKYFQNCHDVHGSRPARGPAINSPANAHYTLLQLRRTYRWHDGCWGNGKFLVMSNREVSDQHSVHRLHQNELRRFRGYTTRSRSTHVQRLREMAATTSSLDRSSSGIQRAPRSMLAEAERTQ